MRGGTKLLTLLVAGSLVFGAYAPQAAASIRDHRRVMACHAILTPDRRDKDRIARFVRCAGEAWGAPGSASYWLSIARCESGLYWRSYNPGGPYVGIYQHSLSAWPERVSRYIRPLELHNTKWENPEANVIVAMRMARADGTWTAGWSCA